MACSAPGRSWLVPLVQLKISFHCSLMDGVVWYVVMWCYLMMHTFTQYACTQEPWIAETLDGFEIKCWGRKH